MCCHGWSPGAPGRNPWMRCQENDPPPKGAEEPGPGRLPPMPRNPPPDAPIAPPMTDRNPPNTNGLQQSAISRILLLTRWGGALVHYNFAAVAQRALARPAMARPTAGARAPADDLPAPAIGTGNGRSVTEYGQTLSGGVAGHQCDGNSRLRGGMQCLFEGYAVDLKRSPRHLRRHVPFGEHSHVSSFISRLPPGRWAFTIRRISPPKRIGAGLRTRRPLRAIPAAFVSRGLRLA